MTEPPIACSLDQNALEARLAAAAEVGSAGLVSREQVAGRYILRFRADPEIRGRLEEIVNAERECCPFLNIGLEERADELELAIEAPAGGEETAAALAAAFDGAAGGEIADWGQAVRILGTGFPFSSPILGRDYPNLM